MNCYEKNIDLVFGMTAVTPDRSLYADDLVAVFDRLPTKITYKFFLRNHKKKIKTFVSRDEYLTYIAASKFTLIIPAYDKMQFSASRFIEAIYYDCLPLIDEACSYMGFFTSFGISENDVSSLVININDLDSKLTSFTDSKREALLHLLKEKLFCSNMETKLCEIKDKKNVVASFIRRGVSANISKSLVQQASFVSQFSNPILTLPLMTDRYSTYVEKHSRTHYEKTILTGMDRYTLRHMPYESWREYITCTDVFSGMNDIDAIITFGSLCIPPFNRTRNKLNTMYDTRFAFGLEMASQQIATIYYVMELSNRCAAPVYEICFDPDENSLSQIDLFDIKPRTFHAYDIPEYNIERLDTLQHYLLTH